MALQNTEVIIIIGYSLPYFNREIDSYIMQCFEKYANGKVYVQSLPDNVYELIENVKELRTTWETRSVRSAHKTHTEYDILETKFIAKSGVDQFYMSF